LGHGWKKMEEDKQGRLAPAPLRPPGILVYAVSAARTHLLQSSPIRG